MEKQKIKFNSNKMDKKTTLNNYKIKNKKRRNKKKKDKSSKGNKNIKLRLKI